jgi:formate dehydrogenase iron-sulfur subunit
MVAEASAVLSTRPKERREPVRLPLVQQYLKEQQKLTAVERFSQRHEADALGPDARYYRDLLPLERPGPGEQLAFQVDLDACTGCKACVTACHRLNGLDDDEGETWRSVGLLHGGSADAPVQQTVTTACHHCLDPACMKGCPVGAYEKDPVTGIVKHLDDQCIGCQYCTLTCPYEVPQYSKKRGIVRKCDMCSDRLAEGEPPACVQACPNEAISIRIVSTARVLEDAQGEAFLPGAPSPNITVPTTTYKTRRVLPRNVVPADFHRVRSSHQHLPLVLLLVLTQLSVGAFVTDLVLGGFGQSHALGIGRPYQSVVALLLGLLALGASIFHLGRPKYAFRAVLGIRTSWMSREALAFGLFAQAAVAYAALFWAEPIARLVGFTLPPSERSRPGGRRFGRSRRTLLGDDLPGDLAPLVERGTHDLALRPHRRDPRHLDDEPLALGGGRPRAQLARGARDRDLALDAPRRPVARETPARRGNPRASARTRPGRAETHCAAPDR